MLLRLVTANAQAPATGRSFSLKEAIDYAAVNAYAAKNSKIDLDKAKYQMDALIAIGLPQVNGSFAYNYNVRPPVAFLPAQIINPFAAPGEFAAVTFAPKQTSNPSLSLNQLLFDGTYFIGLQAAAAFKLLSTQIDQKNIIDIKENVESSYNLVLVLQENIKILNKNLEKLKDTKFQSQAIYNEGFIEETDVDQLTLIVNTLEANIKNLERQVVLAKHLLKFNMGIGIDEDITLTDGFETLIANLPTTTAISVAANPDNNIDLIILNQQDKLARLNVKREQSAYLPQLVGFFNYQWQNFSNNNTPFRDMSKYFPISVAGVQLNVPIFDGLRKQHIIRGAKADVKKIEFGKTQLTEGIKLQGAQLTTDYNNALEMFKLKKSNLDLADKLKARALTKYREGVGTSLELVTAENQYITIQGEYMNAVANLLNINVKINKLTGKYN